MLFSTSSNRCYLLYFGATTACKWFVLSEKRFLHFPNAEESKSSPHLIFLVLTLLTQFFNLAWRFLIFTAPRNSKKPKRYLNRNIMKEKLRAEPLCPNIYTHETPWQNTSVIQTNKENFISGYEQLLREISAWSEGISFQQHPGPQEKPVLHKRDWSAMCTSALHLSIFHTSHFCLHFVYSLSSSDTVFILRIRKQQPNSHWCLDQLPWTPRLLR